MSKTKHAEDTIDVPLSVDDHGPQHPVGVADAARFVTIRIVTGDYNEDRRLAALIVRACNEHDELVARRDALLSKWASLLENMRSQREGVDSYCCGELIDEVIGECESAILGADDA